MEYTFHIEEFSRNYAVDTGVAPPSTARTQGWYFFRSVVTEK